MAMAMASGVVAYTGTSTVDESTKTIHVNIEASSFPNLAGAQNQRRIVTSITDDELKKLQIHARRPASRWSWCSSGLNENVKA